MWESGPISVTRSFGNLGSMMRAVRRFSRGQRLPARTGVEPTPATFCIPAIGPMAATYTGGSHGDPDKENG
jgi:hypothetical protein